MELTNSCNFSCEFCPDSRMKRQRGMMSFEMARAIIDDLHRTKAAGLLLFHVMGEPTLHPRLVDVIEYATAKGIETCLTTNGSRLDEALLNELVRAGTGEIIISLQTPDEKTFSLRSAGGIRFAEYSGKVVGAAKRFLSGINIGKTKLTIGFLSSPLRRLIIPIFREVSIADTSSDLKNYLESWAWKIMEGTPYESEYEDVLKQTRKIWTFRENTIKITERLSFKTRVMGDWPVHFDGENVNAVFGYCPGIQENFGILWNGDYTFCCTDYDARTSTHNFRDTPIMDYLAKEAVQNVVRGFQRFRVLHPHCKQCLGDRNLLNAAVKQVGSIIYFKWLRKP